MVRLRDLQVQGRYKEAPLCSGCDAVWQKDSTAWRLFSRRGPSAPARSPTGRSCPVGAGPGEVVLGPRLPRWPRKAARPGGAANGYTPPAP